MEKFTQLQGAFEKTAGKPEPSFESEAYQREYWHHPWGMDNDYGKIRMALVHRPGKELESVNAESIYDPDLDIMFQKDYRLYWQGHTPLDIEKIQEEHDNLVNVLRKEGIEVKYSNIEKDEDLRTTGSGAYLPKLFYPKDPVIAVPHGFVIGRLGALGRQGEERIMAKVLANLDAPILGMIRGTGMVEGGSFAMINPQTAVIGISNRNNEEGALQMERILSDMGVRLIRVPLCGWTIHIDFAFSMLDKDLAIIDPRQLPWWFLCELQSMGIRTIYDSPEELCACHMLVTAPRRIIISKGSERTAERLSKEGVEVAAVVDTTEAWRGGGIVRALPAPLVRDPVE
mgnify:CR=1 FL=1